MAWAWCFICLPCPALPAIGCEMPMSMSNPSRAQELPSHFIPLSYLRVQFVLRSAVDGLPLLCTVACIPTPRRPVSADVPTEVAFPIQNFLLCLSCLSCPCPATPHLILARHRHGPIPNHQKTLRRAGGKGGE